MTVPAVGREYRLVVDENSSDTIRIVAVDDSGVEIAGAYRVRELNHWMLYCTKLVADAVGLSQPHKAHVCSRDDAVRWVDTLACLFARAVTL